MWTACFWPSTGKPHPAKRLNTDDSRNHITIDINITHFAIFNNSINGVVNSAVYP